MQKIYVMIHDLRRVVVAAERRDALATAAVISEAEALVAGRGVPAAGGQDGGRKPPRKTSLAAGDDDRWDSGMPSDLPSWNVDIPELEIKESRLRVAWYGRKKSGGHGDVDGPLSKTYLVNWSYEEFSAAIRSIAENPDFVRVHGGVIVDVYGVRNGVLFRIAPSPDKPKMTKHINPVRGVDVRFMYPDHVDTDRRILPISFSWEEVYRVVR